MLGRHVFMESLVAHGVKRIFGNPGTTESPLLDSLGDYPSIDYIVALHEGVALGAASFYAQASGNNAVVNLHVAPGLGNAMGMLYCAYKANSPIIVTAGQQDTRMRLRDPVLGHDLCAMAAPVTKWSVQAESADELGAIMHRAFKIANDPPAGPVFVALPINVMEQNTSIAPMLSCSTNTNPAPERSALELITQALVHANQPVIVVGDDVARADAGGLLIALAETIGATVWFEALRGHSAVPSRHPHVRGALPVDAAGIAKCLGDADAVFLCGGPFFEDVWHSPTPPFGTYTQVVQLETSPQRLAHNFALHAGAVGALKPGLEAMLAIAKQALGSSHQALISSRNEAIESDAQAARATHTARVQRAAERRPMPMSVAMDVLASSVPAGTAIVDESITASIDLERSFSFTGRGDFFGGRGGGIGQGLPGAVGVQLAMPERRVLCISGDGSAMYSIQALWTAAHHDLPIVFVILANREYRVLKHNLDGYRQRFETGSNQPYVQMDLDGPQLGFVDMAAGMGIQGCRVDAPQAVHDAVVEAFAANAPRIIEIAIEGKR